MKKFFALYLLLLCFVHSNASAQKLFAWGNNVYGQLGQGNTSTSSTLSPVQVGNGSTWKSISCGYYHTVALKTDGTLWAWGNNEYGQLCDGTTINRTSPIQIGNETNWVAISSGNYFTIAIKTDGTIWAWGRNDDGQLGLGDNTNRTSPVQIGSVTNWVSVACGNNHTIAMKTDGTLWAWGYNGNAQLGDGTTTSRTSPVQIGSGTNWAIISCSQAIKTDGTLWAWGWNSYGQIGDGTTTNRYSPVQIGSGTNWASVTCGDQHTIAIKTDGTLWAWGYNEAGELGDGTTTQRTSPVQIGSDTNWAAVYTGVRHTIAIKTDGTLWAWGYNGEGQLGDGTTTQRNSPVQIGSGRNWAAVENGYYHTIAIASLSISIPVLSMPANKLTGIHTNTTFTWNTVSEATSYTIQVSTSADFTNNIIDETVSSASYSSSGLSNNTKYYWRVKASNSDFSSDWSNIWYYTTQKYSSQKLYAWGNNVYGQLGQGNTSISSTLSPVQVGNGSTWKSISCGYYHTVALKTDGTLWAWGNNEYGQLCDGTTINRTSPIQIGNETNWVAISSGNYFTIAIKTDGTIWAWGRNDDGQLGLGDNTNRTSPVQIGSVTNWVSVACGNNHTIAMKTDGTLWAWGYNGNAQLGDGTTTSRTSPVQIGSGTNWAIISCSQAIKTDGTLWAWGWNSYGQIGDGTTTNRYSHVQIGSGTNWASVTCGDQHTIAIKTDGTLWAWGNNDEGKLGDGTNTQRTSPVQIGNGTNWASVDCGRWNTLAIKTDGTLWGWGDNSGGQLGDGTTTNKNSPVQIGSGTSWTSVNCRFSHSIALFGVSSPLMSQPANKLTGIPPNTNFAWNSVSEATSYTIQVSTSADFTNNIINETVSSASYSSSGLSNNTKYYWRVKASNSDFSSDWSNIWYYTTQKYSSQKLYAWGYNEYGQLGDGTTTNRNSPVQISNGTSWATVSSGLYHTNAIKTDGTLWAWGYNSNGFLGDGTTINRISPVQIGSSTNWAVVLSGAHYTLAIKTNGTLWAWGNNNYGQLGDGTTTYKTSPVQIGSGTNWLSVSCGNHYSMGIKTDGTLWAWGYNQFGQLGDGTTTDRSCPVQVGSDNNWAYISCCHGANHSMAIKTDGTLWAWGYNQYGQIGDGSSTNRSSPVQIGSNNDWKIVACGYYHTHGIKTDGTLWAWGYNQCGQLGDGTTSNETSPVQIGSDSDWMTVSGGSYQTLGIKTDGTLWAWGYNQYGQLGDGTTTNSTSPLQIGSSTEWTFIVAGRYNTTAFQGISAPTLIQPANKLTGIPPNTNFAWNSVSEATSYTIQVSTSADFTNNIINETVSNASYTASWLSNNTKYYWRVKAINSDLTSDWSDTWYFTTQKYSSQKLFAWGSNTYGQLGDGTAIQKNSPVQIGTGTNWASISSGQRHTVAIKTDGTLWAWGRNTNGQLGDGTATDRTSPVQIGSGTNWASVSCGATHSVAIKTDGTLWAWGWNVYGNLGDGTNTERSSPVQIGSGTDWASVSCGFYHTIAIKTDGTLWAWGNNYYGQLGDGTGLDKSSPVQIGSGTNWTSVACGAQHNIALKTDGTLWAWGYNYFGQFGDGNNTDRSSPVQIGSGTNWASVSCGVYHTIAIKTDGTLWASGWNVNGQLGDGTTTDRSSPVQIGSSTNWASVSCGWYYTMTIKTDETLWAWGANLDGQLGDGTTTQKTSPVQIGSGTNWTAVISGGNHTLALESVPPITAPTLSLPSNSSTANSIAPVLSWNSSSFATGYELQVSSSASFTSLLVNQTNLSETSITASSLDYNNTYYWRVRAHNEADTSDWSEVWSFTTEEETVTGKKLFAWGDNENGQLGDGTITNRLTPVRIGNDKDWIVLSSGEANTEAIKTDGTLWAWGLNNNGQLGDGTNTERHSPVQIGTDNTWKIISSGSHFTMAIKSNGTLWAWGENWYGNLGNGTTTDQYSPVQIGSATNWKTLACGGYHTIAIKQDGTLWAWGYNVDGQLGDGSRATRTSPVQIGTGNDWKFVTCGYSYSVAIKTDGTLWLWGNNSYGQLGDGTTTYRTSPVQIGNNTNWKSVSCGYMHTIALKTDGTLWAWGFNWFGQLGDGTTVSRNNPVQIGSNNNWVSITCGDLYTTALKTNGTLWEWGYNYFGQLGDGSRVDKHSPIQIGNGNKWVSSKNGYQHTLALYSLPNIASPELSSPSNEATDVSISPLLSWSSVTISSGYELQISTSVSFISFLVNQTNLNETSYTASGLDYNTTYYWRVRAHNEADTSDWSEVWSFTTETGNSAYTITVNKSDGTPLEGAVVSYQDVTWISLGITNSAGQVTVSMTNGTYNFSASYLGTSVTSSATVPGNLTFYTTKASVLVAGCDNTPVQGVDVNYVTDSQHNGDATNSGGYSYSELFPGTYSFTAAIAGTSSSQNLTVTGDGMTANQEATATFNSTKVTLNFPGSISFTTGSGNHSFTAPEMYLFPGTYSFSFAQSGEPAMSSDIVVSGCSVALRPIVFVLKDHNNNPLSNGTVHASSGDLPGTTGTNGALLYLAPSITGNASFDMKYNHTLQTVTQDVSSNPYIHYRTSLVTLRLEKCDGTPLNGATARFQSDAACNFPGTNQTGSSVSGETEAEMFAGSFSWFELNYQHTSQQQASVTIAGSPSYHTTVVWKTKNVTFQYSGDISYGGTGDDAAFNKPSMELLPGDVRFNFGTNGNGYATVTIPTGCTPVSYKIVKINFLNSTNEGITGGTASFYTGSGSWNTFGNTINGVLILYYTGTTNSLMFKMNYANATQQTGWQNITTNSIVNFKTTRVKLELRNSDNNYISGEDGTAKYYTGTGSWITIGNTTSNGFAEIELLPVSYLFNLNYANATQQTGWVAITDNNRTVTFKTSKVKVELRNSDNNLITGQDGITKYYTGTGSWLDIGNVTANGYYEKELLPVSYLFNMNYANATQQTGWTAITDNNRIVVFRTTKVRVEFRNSDNNLITGQDGITKYYTGTGSWLDIGNVTANGYYEKELLPVSYLFNMNYANATQQTGWTAITDNNRIVVFKTSKVRVELRNSDNNLITGQDGITKYYTGTGSWLDIGNVTTNGYYEKELLPVSYLFNMNYANATQQTGWTAITDNNRIVLFKTSKVRVELRNSNNNLITGEDGITKYYTGTGSWLDIGNVTANGYYEKELLPVSYLFNMNYANATQQTGWTAITDNNRSVVFKTTKVRVELRNSDNNMITGEDGITKYYTGVGSWLDIGNVTANGYYEKELLPVSYLFNMNYANATQQTGWTAITDNNRIVVFRLTKVRVELRNSGNNLITGLDGIAKYYTGVGSWLDIGNTTTNGYVEKELLPVSYLFNMNYANDTKQTSWIAISNTNRIVTFSTINITIHVQGSGGAAKADATVDYYTGTGNWLSIGTTNTSGNVSKELLPVSNLYRAAKTGYTTTQTGWTSSTNVTITFPTPKKSLDQPDEITDFELIQNYPNPFNSLTNISFSIPSNCNANLNIYDMNGNFIKEIFNGSMDKGNYQFVWNGENSSGIPMSGGMYMYVLKAGDVNLQKTMMLVK